MFAPTVLRSRHDWKAGIIVREIAEYLGHERISVTRDVYIGTSI
jgi:hypothetical protein